MELKSEEVICDKCNGKGLFCNVESKHVTLDYCIGNQCLTKCSGFDFQTCPKCKGEGKLDWVENVVGKNKIYSSLDQINIRRIILSIEQHITSCLKNLDMSSTALDNISTHLELLKTKNIINEYLISSNPEDTVEVFIKPNKSIEVVRITAKVKKDV